MANTSFRLSTGRVVTLKEIMGLRPLDKPRGKFTDKLTLHGSSEVLYLLPAEATRIQRAMFPGSVVK